MASSAHVGPVIFSHPVARRQLEEHGEVITARKDERTTGKTWYRYSRTGPKQGDVELTYIGLAYLASDLEPYVERSGFDHILDWVGAIEEFHGPTYSVHLYRATLLQGDEVGPSGGGQ